MLFLQVSQENINSNATQQQLVSQLINHKPCTHFLRSATRYRKTSGNILAYKHNQLEIGRQKNQLNSVRSATTRRERFPNPVLRSGNRNSLKSTLRSLNVYQAEWWLYKKGGVERFFLKTRNRFSSTLSFKGRQDASLLPHHRFHDPSSFRRNLQHRRSSKNHIRNSDWTSIKMATRSL